MKAAGRRAWEALTHIAIQTADRAKDAFNLEPRRGTLPGTWQRFVNFWAICACNSSDALHAVYALVSNLSCLYDRVLLAVDGEVKDILIGLIPGLP